MRLRFSIRDLLLLTVIVALAIGWWLDHRKLTKENSAEFAVFYLKYADAKDACGTLQKLFDGNSGVSVTYDPRLNAIFARGPAKRQGEIEMLLKLTDVSTMTSDRQTSGQ